MSIFNSTDKIYHLLLMKEIHTLGGLCDEQYADLIKTLWGIDIPQHKKGDEEPKTGEWIKTVDGNGWNEWYVFECPFCGAIIEDKQYRSFEYKYCPNCGAKMKGADDE